MHVDTGHNFKETIAFRDKLTEELGVELGKKCSGQYCAGKVQEETGRYASRNMLQTDFVGCYRRVWFDAALVRPEEMKKKRGKRENIFCQR